jgi:segregation and condensation protein B
MSAPADLPPKREARPPLEDAMRRIEDAFAEPGSAPAKQPSADAVRAAEALLFAGGAPLRAPALAEKLGPDVDVAAVLMRLKQDYAGRGVELVETGEGWRFQSAPDLSGLFSETREAPKKLPRAALETLAVIAYHQPVTRAEVEDIRGVSLSRGTLDFLLELGWVRPRGRRRTPGRPLTYGTTDLFLGHFGLPSLDSLPGKDDLKGMGLLDPRAAAALDVPEPSDGLAADEDPLAQGDDGSDFFVDHLDDAD